MSSGGSSGRSADEGAGSCCRAGGPEGGAEPGILIAGADLSVWNLDGQARRLLGLSPDAPPSDALDPSRPATAELRDLLRRCLRHRTEARRSIRGCGEGRALAVRVSPLPVPDGTPAAVALLIDEAQQEELQHQLLDSIGRVAHDLRSPLTVVQGFIEAILDQQTTAPERRRYLSLALQQTHLMARMLEGLGESLEILAGHTGVACQQLNLERCLRETVDAYSLEFSRRSIRLEAFVPEGLPDVAGDEVAVKRVLANLLDNAARHAGDGGWVRVDCDRRPASVAVCVADSGPGVPPGVIERIWDPFVSLQETSARLRRGGSGLGLASVRRLVEAMGGETWAVSEEGRGAQFWFTLPRWVETGGS